MIIQKPNPMLEKKSQPISDFNSKRLKDTIELLYSHMKEANGAGIAAVQIGILEMVFVYGFEHNPRYPDAPPVPETHMINPKITWFSDETVDIEEGCLSVPDKRFLITRPAELKIEYYNVEGKMLEKHATDFEARVIQHEMDHLNGITILERSQQK